MYRKLFLNFSWLTASHIAVKPIWFVFITYVCLRVLGPAEYGVIAAVLALMSIVDGIFMMGTGTMSLREVSRQKDLSDTYFSNFVVTRGGLSLAGIGVGIGLEFLLGNGALAGTAAVAGLYVFFRSFTEYCRTFFRAHDVFKKEAYSAVVEKLFVVTGGSIALVVNPSAFSALTGMAAGMLITALINYRWVIREFAVFTISALDIGFIRKAIPIAVPLGFVSIFILLFVRTDSVMIEYFLGEVPTAEYAIAFRVLEALFILPATATAVLLPRLAVLKKSDPASFSRLAWRAVIGLFLVSLVVAYVIKLYSPQIIMLIDHAKQMTASIFLLQILIWSLPIATMNAILSASLTAADRQNTMAVVLGAAAVLNIGLNYWLIPSIGTAGAAYATIVTQVFVAVSFMILMRDSATRG